MPITATETPRRMKKLRRQILRLRPMSVMIQSGSLVQGKRIVRDTSHIVASGPRSVASSGKSVITDPPDYHRFHGSAPRTPMTPRPTARTIDLRERLGMVLVPDP